MFDNNENEPYDKFMRLFFFVHIWPQAFQQIKSQFDE